MGYQEQQVSFKFAGGVETKMDSKAVPATRLLALENGVFTRAISIKKRNGYERRSRTITGRAEGLTGEAVLVLTPVVEGPIETDLLEVASAIRLAARDDELLAFTPTHCYSQQDTADQWVDAGALIAPLGYDRPAVHTGTAQTTPDHATNGGATVYAWEDSAGGVWWTLKDALSGRVLRAPAQANAAGQRPRCVSVGDALHVYYAVPALRAIYVLVINPSTPTATVTERLLVSDLKTSNPAYDACPTGRTGTPALMVWQEYGTTNLRVGYITAGGSLGSPVHGTPSVRTQAAVPLGNTPVACAYKNIDGADGDFIVLAYMTSTLGVSEGEARVLSAGTTTVAIGTTHNISGTVYAAPTDVSRLTVGEANGRVWAAFEETASEPSERYTVVNSMTFAGDADAEQTIRSVGLASRAFAIGNDCYAVFVHDTTYFNTYLTLRLLDFADTGRHLPGAACGPTRAHLPSAQVDDSVVTIALPYKQRVASTNNDKFGESAIRRVVMDFDSEDSHQTAQLGRGLYLAAACPQHYDGYKWTEQGFHVGPEHITSAVAAGGSLTVSSTYEYKAWYEWTDKQGEVHRGPESIGVTVVTGGADTQATLTLPTLRVTRKDNVRICVARSLPGDTARLWRVSSLDPTLAGAAANRYVANDPTVDSVTFVDRMSDTDLQLQEQIYTVGGILSNDPAPLGSHVAAGRNRLFWTDAQDGNIVRFSQRLATGFGVEHAPELKHDVDPEGGAITALAVMDDIVYVFKANAIFAFNGDGPYENGTSTNGALVSGFSSAQKITSVVGCSDPASIVESPEGILFKSDKGIYMITRGREVVYVGAPVEAYNDQTVRRATQMPGRTAVLFLTDSGLSLYYDYLFQQWSTFTNHEGRDAAVVAGRYHYLRLDDTVFRETPGVYSDGGRRITLRLETAWIHLHEHLQGFQRFWKALILGTWGSPHQLGVQVRTNYDEAWSEPYWLDATGDTSSVGWITGDTANPIGEDPILGSNYGDGNYGDGPYGGTGPDVYQWRYGIHENGQSVQFRFEDFEKAGLAGASFELTELTIVGGILKPDMRPFSGARST